jgi:hypothetical protein
MAVVAKVPAFVLKFEKHALPSSRSDLPLGLAVRESCLNRFDRVAQLFREYAKKKYDALFINRFVAHLVEVEGIAIRGLVFRQRRPCVPPRNGRSRPTPCPFGRLRGRNDRQKRQHVRPFPLASRELPKRLRHALPAAKSFLERARLMPSQASSLLPLCALKCVACLTQVSSNRLGCFGVRRFDAAFLSFCSAV